MDLKCPQKETESEQIQFNGLYLLQHVNIYYSILFLYYSCKYLCIYIQYLFVLLGVYNRQ